MKIIFFGTSGFATVSLKALIKSEHKIDLVVTQPQKKRGRGQKVLPTAVQAYAQEEGVEVVTCKDVNSKDFIQRLKDIGADIFIVVDFGQILSSELLNIPKLFPLNIHASLLPQYRGAAPIQRAILDGKKKTGVTVMKIIKQLDSGDIIAQKKIKIDSSYDAATLRKKLAHMGSELLIDVLQKAAMDDVAFTKQDESKVTYAAKIKKQDGLIVWESPAERILNQVRACNPWPSAYTYFMGKMLKVLRVKLLDRVKDSQPGSVVKAENDEIIIACADYCISITELQLEGKKPLVCAEFLRGCPLPESTILGK